MTAVIRPLSASPAWKSLEAHHQKIRELHLRELFPDDPKRGGEPVPVLTTALYERFSSRGEADYQDKLLSAMRYEFGGHLEKPAK